MKIIVFLHNWAKRTLNFSFEYFVTFICVLTAFQAFYDDKNPKTTLPIKLISYSYSKKIIRPCMEKYSFLTKLALKLTFNV